MTITTLRVSGSEEFHSHLEQSGKIIAHMDAPIIEEKLLTTTMTAEAAVVETDIGSTPVLDEYSHSFTEISEFMARPVEYINNVWAQASTANTDIESFNIADIITSSSTYMNKLSGYNLVRGTCVLRLQLNANPFQQGRLLLHFVPFYRNRSQASAMNVLLIQKTQHPGVEIGCRDTEVILKIPYVAPSLYYDLTALSYDWGKAFLTVLSPLIMDPATTSTTVQYSIWVSFENVEVAAPIPIVAHMDAEGAKAAARPISTALKTAGKVAGTLSSIPALSAYARPVQWAADVSARLAYTLGYSKPALNDSINYYAPQQNRYAASGSGVDTSFPLTIVHNNETGLRTDLTPRSEDEMSFAYLKKVQCLWQSVSWPVNSTTQLLTTAIAPTGFYTQTSITGTGHAVTAKCFAPFAHLAQYFSAWRGSIDLTLKFVKTQYHTGRLELIWTPGTVVGGTADQNIGAMRSIVDIRFSDEVVIKLPWLIGQSYLAPSNGSGTFAINVVNALKAPSNVAQSVDVLIYVRAGDDYELAVPFPLSKVLPVTVLAHMDLIVNETVGGQKTLPLNTRFAEASIGESVQSIRELLLRYSNVLTNTTPGTSGLAINPYFFECVSIKTSDGSLSSPTWGGSLFSQLGSMYAFYRGGMRIAQSSAVTSTIPWKLSLYTNAAMGSTNYVQNATNLDVANAWQNPSTFSNWYTEPGVVTSELGTVYYRVPYFSDCRFSSVQPVFSDTFSGGGDQPFMWGSAYRLLSASQYVSWMRAISDEFQFGYFICTPLLASAYA